jgi:hypothetical protein
MKNFLLLLFFLPNLASAFNTYNSCDIESDFWDDCAEFTEFESGDVYDGEWKNNKKHGEGYYLFATGDEYSGEWKNDSFYKGTLTYADGRIYHGEFKNNLRHGQGSYVYFIVGVTLTTLEYDGEWKNDSFYKGTLTYDNGDTYTGQFKNNLRHGQGTLYINDLNSEYYGVTYTGEWKNNKIHGPGTYTFLDGTTKQFGEWESDNF